MQPMANAGKNLICGAKSRCVIYGVDFRLAAVVLCCIFRRTSKTVKECFLIIGMELTEDNLVTLSEYLKHTLSADVNVRRPG